METTDSARRVVLIGLDGMIPEMLEAFVSEGSLPTMERLMAEGVYSPMRPSPPVDTPTNWTSIATGAWTGTHGNNSFGVHLDGQSFHNLAHLGPNIFPKFANAAPVWLNELSQAEYLWQAAQRAGKQCILVNYPGGWPPNAEGVITVDGSGPYSSPLVRIADQVAWTTSPEQPGDVLIGLRPQEGRAGALTPLRAEIVISSAESAGVAYHLEVLGAPDTGYDRLSVTKHADGEPVHIGTLRSGETTGWLEEDFDTPAGRVRGKFKLQLSHVDRAGKDLRLSRTAIFNYKGWVSPEPLAHDLIDAFGLLENSKLPPPGATPQAQVYEATIDQATGVAQMCEYLTARHSWDILFAQIHAPDTLNHEALNHLTPAWSHYNAEDAERWREVFRGEYQTLDGAVARILSACADEDTLVVVLSDHGALPTVRTVWVGSYLIEAGLLAYESDGNEWTTDWHRTKIILGDYPLATNIWINLRGREEHGTVEPGEEYEEVRTQVISALYAIRDPKTGACPIALALRKEDAGFLGQWGNRVGDIVYYFAPEYCNQRSIHSVGPFAAALVRSDPFSDVDEGVWSSRGVFLQGVHDPWLPDARFQGFSLMAVFMMKGPGVVAGERLPTPLDTVDVVPTLAHLAQLPLPAQSEGKIIARALSPETEAEE